MEKENKAKEGGNKAKESNEKEICDSAFCIRELQEKALAFRDKRDWKRFHKPKDVALALSIEVSEILEHFRYKTDAEIEEYLKEPSNKNEVAKEIADVFIYLLILSNETNIDIAESTIAKLKELEIKYPAEKCRGKAYKYTHYQNDSK